MRRVFRTWTRTVARAVPVRARSALVVGAWLAATLLFAVAGIALVGTVVAALEHSRGFVPVLVVVFGFVGAYAAAPTLARLVVVAVVADLLSEPDRDADAASDRQATDTSGSMATKVVPDSWEHSSCETEWRHCRTCCS